MNILMAWSVAAMCAACVAIAQPFPLPPLSFQSGAADLPRAIAPKVELARGIVFDDRYRVPTASWPNADLSFEQAAIRAIVQSLQLRWELAREVYGVAPAASPLSAAPVLIGKETVPIAIVPDPQNVVSSLAGVKPSPKNGVFFAPGDIRPKITGGFSGITIYIPRTGAGQASGPLTPRMQGVPPSAVPISPIKGKEPDVLGRVVSRYGVMGADQLGIYDDIIAQASTAMITRSIWYYRLEVANPHKGKRSGGRMGVLDDAAVSNDWCFPIMDANGQARGTDDVRKAERSSPYENLVTTKLLDFPIKGQQAPIVLPTAWYSSHDTMSAEYKAIFDAYEGTETIVLPQRDGAAAPQPSDERALIDPFLGDPATFRFLGVATRTPHITEFPLEARGKSAVYMLRWVSTRGTPGPWSDIASATVAA